MSSNTFAERQQEDRRTSILRMLARQNDYSAHEHTVRDYLAGIGDTISADQMRSELAWLDEQGAIVVSGEKVQVATITMRGADIASGAARVPGIARPRPQ